MASYREIRNLVLSDGMTDRPKSSWDSEKLFEPGARLTLHKRRCPNCDVEEGGYHRNWCVSVLNTPVTSETILPVPTGKEPYEAAMDWYRENSPRTPYDVKREEAEEALEACYAPNENAQAEGFPAYDLPDFFDAEKQALDREFYSRFDDITRPEHYNRAGIECIEAIEASMSPEEFKGYLKGNVEKYTWRYRYKGGLKDLRKAQWYLNKLIDFVETEELEKQMELPF